MRRLVLAAALFSTACPEEPHGPRSTPPLVPVEAGPSPNQRDAAPPPPLDAGPSDSANRGGRVGAALELLAGRLPASSLPVVATEPGQALNPDGIRDALAPVVRSGVRVPLVRTGAFRQTAGTTVFDKAPIRRVVRRHVNEAKFCYEQQIPQKADLAGRITATVTIGSNGAVTNVSATPFPDGGTWGEVAVECIRRALRRWQFDPLPGAPVTFEIPMTFSMVEDRGDEE